MRHESQPAANVKNAGPQTKFSISGEHLVLESIGRKGYLQGRCPHGVPNNDTAVQERVCLWCATVFILLLRDIADHKLLGLRVGCLRTIVASSVAE